MKCSEHLLLLFLSGSRVLRRQRNKCPTSCGVSASWLVVSVLRLDFLFLFLIVYCCYRIYWLVVVCFLFAATKQNWTTFCTPRLEIIGKVLCQSTKHGSQESIQHGASNSWILQWRWDCLISFFYCSPILKVIETMTPSIKNSLLFQWAEGHNWCQTSIIKIADHRQKQRVQKRILLVSSIITTTMQKIQKKTAFSQILRQNHKKTIQQAQQKNILKMFLTYKTKPFQTLQLWNLSRKKAKKILTLFLHT